jgi:hypothetical protein
MDSDVGQPSNSVDADDAEPGGSSRTGGGVLPGQQKLIY